MFFTLGGGIIFKKEKRSQLSCLNQLSAPHSPSRKPEKVDQGPNNRGSRRCHHLLLLCGQHPCMPYFRLLHISPRQPPASRRNTWRDAAAVAGRSAAAQGGRCWKLWEALCGLCHTHNTAALPRTHTRRHTYLRPSTPDGQLLSGSEEQQEWPFLLPHLPSLILFLSLSISACCLLPFSSVHISEEKIPSSPLFQAPRLTILLPGASAESFTTFVVAHQTNNQSKVWSNEAFPWSSYRFFKTCSVHSVNELWSYNLYNIFTFFGKCLFAKWLKFCVERTVLTSCHTFLMEFRSDLWLGICKTLIWTVQEVHKKHDLTTYSKSPVNIALTHKQKKTYTKERMPQVAKITAS